MALLMAWKEHFVMRVSVRWCLPLLLILAGGHASATCTSLTASVTPSAFLSNLAGAGTFGFGTLTLNGTDCVLGAFGGFYLMLPIGATAQSMTGPTNVRIATNGTAVTAVANGSTGNNCAAQVAYSAGFSAAWTTGSQTAIAFAGPGGFRCHVTVQQPVKFSKLGGLVAGTAAPGVNPTNVTPSLGGFGVPTVWVSKANFGWPTQDGTPAQTVGLSGLLSFAQPNCTLGFSLTGAGNSLNLPTVGVSDLATDGVTAGATPFNLHLSSCSNNAAAPVSVKVTWGFTAKNALPTVIDTGIARLGVQVQCGGALISNAVASTVATMNAGLSNGAFSQACAAMYVAVGGAASPGTFSVPVTLTLGYQ